MTELPDDMEARTPAPEGEALQTAALALYMAGRWSCDRPVDEAALWIALRDALGLAPETATQAGIASPVVPVGVRRRVLDELDKAWLHGQRRTSWRRDEAADAILAALRPTDTGRE
jgi:hypothetical protein